MNVRVTFSKKFCGLALAPASLLTLLTGGFFVHFVFSRVPRHIDIFSPIGISVWAYFFKQIHDFFDQKVGL
jgi:hypothetical protein